MGVSKLNSKEGLEGGGQGWEKRAQPGSVWLKGPPAGLNLPKISCFKLSCLGLLLALILGLYYAEFDPDSDGLFAF